MINQVYKLLVVRTNKPNVLDLNELLKVPSFKCNLS